MTLQTYVPGGALTEYIEMFWAWEGYHPPHPRERILPTGILEITITLGATPFQVYHAAHLTQPQIIHGPMAAGAQSDFFLIDTSQSMSLLSVWFKPGGAVPFFAASGQELHNLHLPLDQVWGRQANDMYERLLEAQTLLQRFQILEQTLLQRLQQAKQRHQAVQYALRIFRNIPHIPPLKELLETLSISSTRFIQLFREDIGLTPKQFCRVQRFQHTIRQIAASTTPNWAELAIDCGYYDQAHFINEFRSFSGITPATYAPQSLEHPTNLPVFDPA